jgi:type I restriction enzyme M protein
LLLNYNLHTIVRLPNGVFAPYTPIPTNLLFFDRSCPTKDIWFYEQSLPEARRQYTKTLPIQFEEFTDCIAWWNRRTESDRAWKVAANEILNYAADGRTILSVNLDHQNPRRKQMHDFLPPDELLNQILKTEERITDIMIEIRKELASGSVC